MSIFGKIKKGVNKVSKVVGKIAKSPVTKVGAAGLTLVCPPAGLGMAAAIPVAAKMSDAVTKGTATQRKAAKKILTTTAAAAKKGDAGAKRMLALVAANTQAKKGDKKAQLIVAGAAKTAAAIIKRDTAVVTRFELQKSGRIRKVA